MWPFANIMKAFMFLDAHVLNTFLYILADIVIKKNAFVLRTCVGGQRVKQHKLGSSYTNVSKILNTYFPPSFSMTLFHLDINKCKKFRLSSVE